MEVKALAVEADGVIVDKMLVDDVALDVVDGFPLDVDCTDPLAIYASVVVTEVV